LGDRETLQGILFVLYTVIAWPHLPSEHASDRGRPAVAASTSGAGWRAGQAA